MKKIKFIFVILLLAGSIHAQMIVNHGAQLIQTDGGYLVLNNGDFLLKNQDIDKVFTLSNLTINTSTSLTIDDKSFLTVQQNINNFSGTGGLILNSSINSTASLLHHNENVPATIKRYITGNSNISNTYDYHLVSIPINAPAIAGLFTGMYLYRFDQATQTWVNLGNNASTALPNNEGYMVFYPNEATIVNISGQLNNNSFSPSTMMMNNEFALVPNPYPSAISWDAPDGWTKTNLKDFFYLWDPIANNYVSWNAGAGTAGSPHIPVGQSFFVKADSDSPALSMNNNARLHSQQGFWKKASALASDVFHLKVKRTESSDELIVRFDKNADLDYGYMDVDKLYGAATSPQIYSLCTNNDKLTTNAMPPQENTLVIPIGFECDLTGEFEFTASGMESFSSLNSFILEDKLLNHWVQFKNETSYQFTHNPANDAMRFNLHIYGTNNNSGEEIGNHAIWVQHNQLNIDLPTLSGQKATIELYDLLGHTLLSDVVCLSSPTQLSFPFNASVVVVRVKTQNAMITKKIIL